LTAGVRSSGSNNTYHFSGVDITLSFPIIRNIVAGYPKYESTNGTATKNSLNILHNSKKEDVNHQLTATINKPVSKYGFVVQDADSNENSRYIESITLKTIGGIFSNFKTSNHELTNSSQTISGIPWQNCSTSNSCNFNVDWGYKPALTPFTITHGNTYSGASTTTSAGDHLVGYSDFYFCLAPPKLVVKKQLNGTRIHDTDAKRDQFEIKVTGDAIVSNSATTTGTGATVSNEGSSVLNLAENTSYTITERVMNGTTLGDITDYNATYTCTNATTGSTTIMPTAAMTYNATAQTRSFTLSNTTYGDEITCTITNTPVTYTFSGIVFNDNGGIVAAERTKQDTSSTFTGNSSYFNGIYDSESELGIYDSSLSVRLTDCNDNDIVTISPNPQTVSSILGNKGRYSFTVAANILAEKTKVCLIENEPNVWDYTIDTTTNNRELALIANVYDYSKVDFGEVKANNAALVLITSQYVHECNNSLNYQDISHNNDDPTVGFSIKTPDSGVSPRKCIAYVIQAYNRGHLELQQVQITSVTSVFNQPPPLFLPTSVGDPIVTYGKNGEIRSTPFNLSAVPTDSTKPNLASLYFNTKYGITMNPQ